MDEELQILIPVKLDDSKIKDSINAIQSKISNNADLGLKLFAQISKESLSAIQAQLSNLIKNNTAINIGVNTGSVANQIIQAENQIKASIQSVNQQAVVKPSVEIDKKAIDNMVNEFNRIFDISYKRGNKSSKGIKNEITNLMTEYYQAAKMGDGNKLGSLSQQLIDFANAYSRLQPNPEAIQDLKDFKNVYGELVGIGKKVAFSPNTFKEIVDAVGEYKSAKKLLDTALGVGQWSTHGKAGDSMSWSMIGEGGLSGQFAGMGIGERIAKYCQMLIDLRNNIDSTKSSVVDFMTVADMKSGLNQVLNVSGIKNQATEVHQLTTAFKNANGEIQITRDLFNQFTNNGTNTSSFDAMLGKIGVNNYKVVDNNVQNAISNYEQLRQVYNDVALVQQKYQQTAQQTAQVEQSTVQTNQQVSNSINSVSASLNNATQSSNTFRTYFDKFPNDIAATSSAVEYLKNEFSKLGDVSATTNKGTPLAGTPEHFKDIAIKVKSATGELQNFYYHIKNIGDNKNPVLVYSLENIQETDAGVKKLQSDIEKTKSSYQAKLANFESTNQGLTGGLQSEIQAVQTAINNLSTYDGIKNVEIAFNNLVASSKEITANIKAVGSSLNPIDNAENVISKMPVDIQKLANGFSALKKQPEDADNIIKQLQNDLQKVIELENQGGKNKEWSEAYKILQQDLRNSTNYLKLLQETEKSSTGANSLVNNVKSYQTLLQQTANEWKNQGLYIGEVKKQMSSMLSHIGQIKNEAKLQEYVNNFNKLSTEVLRVKSNLDSQVESQNKIYQLQTQIAKLGVNDTTNKALLASQLNIEQQKLNNLQMQGVTLKNIISLEEQEKYVTEATADARNQMVMVQNHANDKALADNIKQVKDYETAINKAITALNSLKNNGSFSKNANNANVQTQIAEINSLISQLSVFSQTVHGALSSGTIDATQFANLSAEMTTLQAKVDSTTSSVKAFQTQLRQTNGQEAQIQKNKVLIAQLESYAVANSKAMKSNKTLQSGLTPSQEINNMLTALKAGADSSDWSKIQSNFKIVRSEIKALGLEGGTVLQTLWAQVKKFSRWMGVTMITASIAREIRGLFTDVAELDTALVDLRKTFKGTAQDLEEFYYDANDIAKQLGVTTKEVIDQASAWSRLGYSTKEAATEMSKLSSMFASISPGMDVDTATEGLISVMKSFKVDVDDVKEKIMSPINEIGNTYATDNSQIIEGLQKSSAAMAAMGSNFEETVALFTAGQEVVQDASLMGNALRSISMRVRGKSLPPYCENNMLHYA